VTPPRKTSGVALKKATIQEKSLRLTIAQAKEALALTFGVEPEAIEITIRG